MMEAGAVLVGGHTIQDDEPKYGLCVSGFVHPKKIFKNYGCRPGDKLILTKQIGNGVVNTAIKAEMASQRAIHEAEIVMSSLNKRQKKLWRNMMCPHVRTSPDLDFWDMVRRWRQQVRFA